MAEYELLEERLISGKGVLKVPSGKDDFRHSVLYLDVIREPKNKYLNRNWNPDRSKYAYLSFIRNGYVIANDTMEFEKQAYDGIADISGQTLLAVKCAYEGTLISFANIAIALGLTLTQYTDLIKDYENLQLGWEQVLIKCYADTAIQARLYGVKYDVCNPDKDKKKKPPPPPPPLPKVPPGTPIGDLSSPYDSDTNDDGNTDYYEGDNSPPPAPEPPGVRCVKYKVTIRHGTSYGNATVDREITVYGEVGQPFIYPSGGARAVVLPCHGYAMPGLDDGCLPEMTNRTVYSSDSVWETPPPEIVGFEEVP